MLPDSTRPALGAALAAALLLSACGTGEDTEPQPEGTLSPETGHGTAEPEAGAQGHDDVDAPPADEPPSPELQEFYDQQVDWQECDDAEHCATVRVPLDYDDPEGGEIEIELVADSVEQDQPYLLTNPGGPGESGVDIVADYASAMFTDELRESYNLVGFDPRGVYRSEGLTCMSDEEMDQYRQQVTEEDLDDDAAYAEAQEQARELGEQCAQRSGEILAHVDTFSAARDMDILRAALGEQQLHYLGFSYGTKLGLAYAQEHPERVGRFVLDSMVDVTVPAHELSLAQAVGFETALEGFSEWCVEQESCPAASPDEVVSTVQGLFEQISEEPVTAPDGRTMNVSTLVSGFITPMYVPEGWPILLQALNAALEEQDYYAFQFLADQQAGRGSDGTYDWINTWAFRGVMCLDYPMAETQEQIEAEYEEMVDAAPTFGPYLGHSGVLCAEWPHEPVNEPWEPELDGVDEVLFIGTTGDPATPVQWAEHMHELVPESSLLIFEGEGHIAYRPGHDCVVERVEDYLLHGELFSGAQQCSAS
ncbi:alpha/beta hydrolase [Nesterenkonia flava]|uniref:Alpha/beta hydrolase n=1 Tax=Nesterenkonia flava TaxID=469799 RepID=A0ABU1FQV5_9MICC|nr:alpha/beta hydrolase [Nesterenkonia flava]MDR5710989.1 alpha/beta hydrolase [Nesterenkonia flava]